MKIDIKSENGAAIATLSGEIDHHNAKELRAELDRFIVSAQPRQLAIDFGGITFMDSSGIGLIMGRSKLMKECGGALEVHNPQPYIRRVLKLSGIRPAETVSDAAPGSTIRAGDRILVVCGDGHTLAIGALQPAGKRMTPAADFLRGHVLPERFDTEV